MGCVPPPAPRYALPRRRHADAYNFWRKVDRRGPASCWPWRGALSSHGYGVAHFGGRLHPAHRVAYMLTIGPIPPSLQVCHRCDRPRCVNPAHLFLGTARDNAADMIAKGRAHRAWGERAGHARLSNRQARAAMNLWAQGATVAELARRFGLSPHAMRALVRGHTWRRLWRAEPCPARPPGAPVDQAGPARGQEKEKES